MTPQEFLKKWRNVELKERSASPSNFNDPCALLGVEDPISSDPTGEWFTFEKGVNNTSGGAGWTDVWRRGCFGWEYKGRHANLERAYGQLLQYSVALENPPLLIVSDKAQLIRDLNAQVRALRPARRNQRLSPLERAARMTEVLILQKQHNITPDEYKSFEESLAGPKRRTHKAAGAGDELLGPNGHRTGLDDEGNLVEWIRHEEGDGGEGEWPLILRRSDDAIHEAYSEFWDKVWWNRHKNRMYELANTPEPPADRDKILAMGQEAARRIEEKYGRENLGWDDFHWGLLSGRMSALAWVSGMEWEESLDT